MHYLRVGIKIATTLSKNNKKATNPFGRNGKKSTLFHKAMALYNENWKIVRIAEELEVNTSTLRRWFRDAGLPPKKSGWAANPDTKGKAKISENNPIFKADPEDKTWGSDANERAIAKDQEETGIIDVANAQPTPPEQYQSYMASQAAKLMRDGLKNMPAPKNVREMEVLDKIARRHFGLDGDKQNGVGSLSIDISILNNAKAAPKKVGKKSTSNKTIDIEPCSPNDPEK
ncbi:MAG: hypothetical protein CMA72_09020 [Euryarchaeota archaeon]|nr:hypothetical protein [Euryarchaeota archaeon]